MSKAVTYEDLIGMLGENYRKIEQSIVNQILLKVDNHYPTAGSYRENVWKSLFEMIVPKKYCIEQGVFIIDSYGNKSKEVDLVIFDEMYTPYIFNYGEIKFIPIEAVAAVVQCKSNSIKPQKLTEWRESIEKLFTSLDSVVRMASNMCDNKELGSVPSSQQVPKYVTQTATRPIMILCAIEPIKSSKKSSTKSITNFEKDFDIILTVDKTEKKLCKYINREEESLEEWNNSLNHALEEREDDSLKIKEAKADRKKINKYNAGNKRGKLLQNLKVMQLNDKEIEEENVLLSLIFQLNQLLMILNNPMLFPHHAYAKRFSDILKEAKEGKNDEQQK